MESRAESRAGGENERGGEKRERGGGGRGEEEKGEERRGAHLVSRRDDGLKASNEKQLGRHALRFSRFAAFAAEIERV